MMRGETPKTLILGRKEVREWESKVRAVRSKPERNAKEKYV